MNILILSDLNIAGQCTFLMQAINKHTPHKARCIIAYDDVFSYDYDILLSRGEFEEAQYLAKDWADFYHFGSYIFNFPGVDFNELVRPDNCCIKYYGSYLRDNGLKCKRYHEHTGIKAITGTDWTITSLLGQSFYHLGSYFTRFGGMAVSEIPRCAPYNKGDVLRIGCSSAGHPAKGYAILEQAIDELVQEGYKVALDKISGMSNKDCLKRKRTNHVNFCSLAGGWGISGVESMFMGQPTMTFLDSFVLSLYPDQPSILIDRNNLKEQIKLFFDPLLWAQYSEKSYRFAIRNFCWGTIIAKYMYIIDLIRNGHTKLPEVIYNA